jgi:hypothetical protein
VILACPPRGCCDVRTERGNSAWERCSSCVSDELCWSGASRGVARRAAGGPPRQSPPLAPGHRRFGNVRKRESGRYQIRYPGPDGRIRTGPETFARKGDAERALVIVEAQITAGEWTDPERGKVTLAEYAAGWIVQRPGLRVRTVDLYNWLLAKHIGPYLGGVPIGKLSTPMIRTWRAELLDQGRVCVDGGEVVPSVARNPDDCGRGRQDSSA